MTTAALQSPIKKFRVPGLDERQVIVGRTGSGKTQFAVWGISVAPFHRQPYILVDTKGDSLINGIAKAKHMSMSDVIPREPGLYIAHPNDVTSEEEWDDFLWRIHAQENTGLLFDEGYMVPKASKAFPAILTQGRSKNIPAIVCAQRPLWLSKFVFSEADHFAVFHLNHVKDRKTVEEFLPPNSMEDRLLPFHSRYYDVKADALFTMSPVPSKEKILADIDRRLPKKQRWF
jgi:hypothetical protein